MKFFTIEWWCDVQDGTESDPTEAFRQHLDLIRDRLPPDLLLLQDSLSLHDSRLHDLSLNVADALLTLTLHGDDGWGGLRMFTLQYTGLVSHKSLSDPDISLPGPNGYGDLGYDETDVLPDGTFKHCLLFSSGIELQFVFTDFRLEYVDSPSPESESAKLHNDAREAVSAGDFARAIELLQKTLSKAPSHGRLLMLGECLVHERRFKEAVVAYEAATSLNNSGIAPAHLAEVWFELGDLYRAKEMIDIALQRQSHYKRAQAFAKKVDEALAQLIDEG